MRAVWLVLLLAACATTADPCHDVTCADGAACDPETGACPPAPPVLPTLDELDLGTATRALPDADGGLLVVSRDREAGRVLTVRLDAQARVREARVVADVGDTDAFDAALDATGRLYVLAPGDDGAGLVLCTPLEPHRAPVVVPATSARRVRGTPSLAAAGDRLEAAFADEQGDLYTLRFDANGAAPEPTRVVLADADAPAVLAEPQVRVFGAGRSYLFFVDESARTVRVAGRETGAWVPSSLLDDVRLTDGATFAAGILPDGGLAALAVDGAGRLVLAERTATGVTQVVVDDGAGDEGLRPRVGAWPALAQGPDGRVLLGAFDVTAARYRAWTLGADGQPGAPRSIEGTLLAPALVAGADGDVVVAGQPLVRGPLWVRRLAVLPLSTSAPSPVPRAP